jgi:hypothetical protein
MMLTNILESLPSLLGDKMTTVEKRKCRPNRRFSRPSVPEQDNGTTLCIRYRTYYSCFLGSWDSCGGCGRQGEHWGKAAAGRLVNPVISRISQSHFAIFIGERDGIRTHDLLIKSLTAVNFLRCFLFP